MNKSYVRHRWELTLALTLFFVLCYAAFCSAQQETLSQDVLRLRVVANSDTQTDQAVKLRVRDQVLTVVQPMQEQAANPDDMRALLQAHMQEITNAAQREVYACGGTQLSRRNWRAIGIRQKRMIRFRFRRDGMTDCSCASARRADTIGGVSYILRCASTRQKERQH